MPARVPGARQLASTIGNLHFGPEVGVGRIKADAPVMGRGGWRFGTWRSYFRIPVRIGTILSGIAVSLGYEPEAVELFRMRFSTVTQTRLREAVLLHGPPRRAPGAGNPSGCPGQSVTLPST